MLPVGALLCEHKYAATIKNILESKGWVKKNGKKVTCTSDKKLAIHVTPDAALILNDTLRASEIPCNLVEMLKSGIAEWRPGFRVGLNDERKIKPFPLSSRFTYIELFAGIGGFRIGLDKIGGHAVFASEINQKAQVTYRANFNETPVGDITELEDSDIPPHDLLTAGFPCQSFSRAGDRKGFDDPRGILFYEITRVLRYHRPKALLLENVANLMRHDSGRTLEIILNEIRNVGYWVDYRIINLRAFLPQQRERIFIVGIRLDLYEKKARDFFTWPKFPIIPYTISDILEEGIDSEYILTDKQWESITQTEEYKNSPSSRLAQLDGCARTLMAHYRKNFYKYSEFVPLNGNNPRFYSPRECARLQGFPETFNISACTEANRIYYQLGNCVSPVIVSALGNCIFRAIEGKLSEGNKDMIDTVELLKMANPHPDKPLSTINVSLNDYLNDFLLDRVNKFPLYNGRGSHLDDNDLIIFNNSLMSSLSQSITITLISRLVDPLNYGLERARINGELLIEDRLLLKIVDVLKNGDEKSKKLALVAIQKFTEAGFEKEVEKVMEK